MANLLHGTCRRDDHRIMEPDPFEVALAAAIEALPEPHRRELGSLAIVVQDEPDTAQLASAGEVAHQLGISDARLRELKARHQG